MMGIPRNIIRSSELSDALNDMNLTVAGNTNKINVYCEDKRAVDFVRYLLTTALEINTDLYMNFVDINLGWTNYVQLYEKNVPEFKNNVIVLDGDVPNKPGYGNKRRIIEAAENILFLPILIEKAFFDMLKDHSVFNRFRERYSQTPTFNYDICFM